MSTEYLPAEVITALLAEADHAEQTGANGGMVLLSPPFLRRCLESLKETLEGADADADDADADIADMQAELAALRAEASNNADCAIGAVKGGGVVLRELAEVKSALEHERHLHAEAAERHATEYHRIATAIGCHVHDDLPSKIIDITYQRDQARAELVEAIKDSNHQCRERVKEVEARIDAEKERDQALAQCKAMEGKRTDEANRANALQAEASRAWAMVDEARAALARMRAVLDGINDNRLKDLAERLVMSGAKAEHLSASECHEISDVVLDAIRSARALSSPAALPDAETGER